MDHRELGRREGLSEGVLDAIDQAVERIGPVIGTKLRNAFVALGIKALTDIPLHSYRDFLLLPNFGSRGIEALLALMDAHDLSFRGEDPRAPAIVSPDDFKPIRDRLLARIAIGATKGRGTNITPEEMVVLSKMLEAEIADLDPPQLQ